VGDWEGLIRAGLAGVGCGFVVSVPVGPVNLTVINQALRRGFAAAFLVGLGAIVAETAYAVLMLAGHASLLDNPGVAWTLRILGVLVLVGVGVRSLLAKPEQLEARSAAAAERVEERWHRPRALLLGFLLTVSNLALVLLWAFVTRVLFDHGWVQAEGVSRAMCALGVFVGGTLWFFLLAFFVSRAHRRVRPQTLTLFVRACGVVFIIFAMLLAYRLFVPARKAVGVDLLQRAS
jgi:threonine/homoserine/homoserine lactone efflux protein